MEFLDVKTDYAFKKVFGSENSKHILKSFLNATLDLDISMKQESFDAQVIAKITGLSVKDAEKL